MLYHQTIGRSRSWYCCLSQDFETNCYRTTHHAPINIMSNLWPPSRFVASCSNIGLSPSIYREVIMPCSYNSGPHALLVPQISQPIAQEGPVEEEASGIGMNDIQYNGMEVMTELMIVTLPPIERDLASHWRRRPLILSTVSDQLVVPLILPPTFNLR